MARSSYRPERGKTGKEEREERTVKKTQTTEKLTSPILRSTRNYMPVTKKKGKYGDKNDIRRIQKGQCPRRRGGRIP